SSGWSPSTGWCRRRSEGAGSVNVARNVSRARAFFPDRTAILFEGRGITYRELDEASNRAANLLRAVGIARGDRVALYLPNVPEFAIVYLGALKAGAV